MRAVPERHDAGCQPHRIRVRAEPRDRRCAWTAPLVILVVLIGFEVLVTMLARSGGETDTPAVTSGHPV